jgi:hypothetical protein
MLITLAYIYNTEVRGRKFTDAEGHEIDSYDALLYKYKGGDMAKRLINGEAKPGSNTYVQNVTNYSNRFKYSL